MTEIHPDKEKIIDLISEWLRRSGLSFRRQVVPRIQIWGIDMSEAALSDRLTRRSERKPDLSPNLALAVISAFTERLTDTERCRATEALLFADLVRLPISQFEQLGTLFPENEFDQALSQYIAAVPSKQRILPPAAILIDFYPKVAINRKDSNFLLDADFLMPLYPHDTLHTYREASAVFLYQNTKSLCRVPEQSICIVDCEDETDKYFVAQLEALLEEQPGLTSGHSLHEPTGLYELREKTILSIVENQAMGNWSSVITQLTKLSKIEHFCTPYLFQRLGDAYCALDKFKDAMYNFQLARLRASEKRDSFAQRSALVSINRLSHISDSISSSHNQMDEQS